MVGLQPVTIGSPTFEHWKVDIIHVLQDEKKIEKRPEISSW